MITRCIIVDSGSEEREYLNTLQKRYPFPITTIFCKNRGFAEANNRGYAEYYKSKSKKRDDIIIFLNPDAFFTKDTAEQVKRVLEKNKDAAIISGRILSCRINTERERTELTGRIDSTGIFRKWYGRWYDRGQGEKECGQYNKEESPQALCGAFMVCRNSFLEQLWQEEGTIFDPSFFLYKEDIELSLRVRKKGWQLLYAPQIEVRHCRGWQKERKKMPYNLRLMAAANEIRLYRKYPSPYILWALLKYILVRFLTI